MKKNIVIIHYNTPVLTEHLVMSINKFVENAIIYIFDNSDKYPFTAKFDNVTILDNTKGQIIDFEKWLEKYPKKNFSNGKVNNWGSAKHCVSVQKCIDIINQNFLLIDSDVLIKKDISDLFDDNYIYCAEVVTQRNSTIKRVLPYLCFINVEKCNEKNVKYFNEKKMHGINYTSGGDRYDTGASFYLDASNLNHKDIKVDEYAVHYGHGSWDKNSDIKQKLFLSKNKNLYSNDENNYVAKLKKYCKERHLNINIDNPRTIQDKINWLKVNNLSQLKTDCADKIKLHSFCEKTIGKDICTPIIKVYDNVNEINWDELPDKFVIKCNHGSGMNIIIDKNNFNKNETINKLNKWMNTDFAFVNGFEMQYHNIERKIFVEKFLIDSNQKKSLFDYKFWCFNGNPQFFTINDGNGHGSWMNFYDMNFNMINLKRKDFIGSPKTEIIFPSKLKDMVEYSKKLSEPFEFVRVDFYEVNGEVILGELTFTPGSGFFKYNDSSYDLKFGDLLKLNKSKNKNVVYTCITGGYDTLIEPKYITEGFDYVCFTDDLTIESNTWEIRQLPNETDELSQVKKQRFVKTHPHLLLSDYDISIWVDGNVELKNDLNDFIEQNDENDCYVFVPEHPSRKCIYDEERAVISMKKDIKENTEKQINRYKEEKFPPKNGLLQSNILFRKHNNEDCIKLMEKWWEEIKNGSHRDQLSFNYASWKLPNVKIKYLDKKLYNSKWFLWKTKHTKKNMQNSVNNEIINIENKHREKIEKLRSRILSKEKIENKTKLGNMGANSKYFKKK